ncbi:hypothetical protein BZA05DRAFT_23908 [Tricharina praecox]|uniref:uncharacterized protein n=1 Tax=Tricharina praecox TaxID=43433 RepID=UPI00221F43AE|nr:uncharacterized protein BZA05DRAFT_23908 [Tricharina praecox]KAI5859205.1 hypothetical protein BZA05DRAFT_23908 [Tricharina praecox]
MPPPPLSPPGIQASQPVSPASTGFQKEKLPTTPRDGLHFPYLHNSTTDAASPAAGRRGSRREHPRPHRPHRPIPTLLYIRHIASFPAPPGRCRSCTSTTPPRRDQDQDPLWRLSEPAICLALVDGLVGGCPEPRFRVWHTHIPYIQHTQGILRTPHIYIHTYSTCQILVPLEWNGVHSGGRFNVSTSDRKWKGKGKKIFEGAGLRLRTATCGTYSCCNLRGTKARS